jgi:hypothetical protein
MPKSSNKFALARQWELLKKLPARGHGLLSLLWVISFPIFVIVPIVAAIGVFLWIRWYNRTKWPLLQQKWERSWICTRCGHTFEK